ncbi:MAG: hypothetical protein KJO07_24275 [Deltaproteobacteria bacterium]|nr:hypothetical protein [Deltaproteobacteria bacterium]
MKVWMVLVAAALGCASGDDRGLISPNPDYKYVVSNLDMPATPGAAQDIGFDLDGDPSARPDNHLGTILSQIFAADIADMDAAADNLVASGDILHLLEVDAPSLEGQHAADAALWVGRDDDGDPSDNFSGAEEFSIVVTGTETLRGSVQMGRLQAGPGTLTVGLALPGGEAPLEIDLVAAHLDVMLDQDGASGRLGGAITKADVDEVLIPFVHSAIDRLVGLDCNGGECTPDSPGEFFLDLLDGNDDGLVSLGELRGHPLVEVLAKPDVDLFDADGALNPRQDGVADALSFAIALDAVGARF